MLTSAEITYMRAQLEDLMPDTCNILSVTHTSDGQGGVTDTWGTATAGVACRLDYMQGVETVFGGAMQPYTGWKLTLPYDTSLTTAQRVEHGGNTYNVIEVDTDKSWPIVLRARLARA
jgi:head-tail adaptor